MTLRNWRRKRGVVLTTKGLQKLQEAKRQSEAKENFGNSYTLEEMSTMTGLYSSTISKVLNREGGVDKKTLEKLFLVFKAKIDLSDYLSSNTHLDWGDATYPSIFYGRTDELIALEQWVLDERCQLIALLGMGGIGKTSLSVKISQHIQEDFEYIIWRSLREAPPVTAILSNLIQVLSDDNTPERKLSENLGEGISQLIYYLQNSRCLVILDNVESILRSGSRAGQYREGYEGYSELFRRLGETSHTSCLILTSREKPKEIALLEGKQLPVRSLQLRGLKVLEAQEILKVKGLTAAEDEWKEIIERYAGNPLALKIVATTIQDIFDGNVTEFLQENTSVFGDIRDILDRQFERLSDLEKEIIYWLAINREPVTFSELRQDIVLPRPTQKLLESLESSVRRSLVEKSAATFTLQPVVMEYVTQVLIEDVCEEIVTDNIELFQCHALMKATAKDYIKEAQIRLILQPVIHGLLIVLKSQRAIENHLTKILARLRQESPLEPGYTTGNIINLLSQLKIDLKGYDFSSLTVWQADLQNVKLHNVNFQNANLAKSVFAETFGGILSVAFSPDGKLLAIGDTNGEIRLYQISDWKQLLTCKGHTNWVLSLAFNNDGSTLVSGSTDHTVKLWNTSTGECLQTLTGHEHEVWSVAFSPDAQTVVSGSDDQTMRLWSVRSGQCLKTFLGHTSWVLSVAFSKNEQVLVSGSDDQTIKLWDINTGECFKTFQGHCDGIRSIVVSPDGKMVASGSDDQTLKLWDINTGECLTTFQGHSNEIYSVAFSPRGDLLASGSFDQTVRLWSVNTYECLKTFHGHSSWVFSVAFSPQDDFLVSGSYDQTVRLWNVRTSQCLKTFQGYTNQVLSIAFSPNGQTLASGSHDSSVRLWNVNTGQCWKLLQGHRAAVWSIAFSPKEMMLASGSLDQTIKLWDITTGECKRTLEGHTTWVLSIAFSPDGELLASTSPDGTLKLWSISTSKSTVTLQDNTGGLQSVTFSPDSLTLASNGQDNTVKLWDVNTGQCLKVLQGHTGRLWSVIFSPDNQILASSGDDETIRLWHIATGECLKTLKAEQPYECMNIIGVTGLTTATIATLKVLGAAVSEKQPI